MAHIREETAAGAHVVIDAAHFVAVAVDGVGRAHEVVDRGRRNGGGREGREISLGGGVQLVGGDLVTRERGAVYGGAAKGGAEGIVQGGQAGEVSAPHGGGGNRADEDV